MMTEEKFMVVGRTNSRQPVLWKFNFIDVIVLGSDLLINGLLIYILCRFTNVNIAFAIVLPLIFMLAIATLVIPITDDIRVYNQFVKFMKYVFRLKSTQETPIPLTFNEDGTVVSGSGMLSAIIRIQGSNLMIANPEKRMMAFRQLANVCRKVETGKIISSQSIQNLDSFIERYKNLYLKNTEPSRKELSGINFASFDGMKTIGVKLNTFYMVVYANNKTLLQDKIDYVMANLTNSVMLDKEEAIGFYKQYYINIKPEDKKKDTVYLPAIQEKGKEIIINGKHYTLMSVHKIPSIVGGEFLAPLFQISGIYVNINFNIDNDMAKINKRLNKQINRMEAGFSEINNETQRLIIAEQCEALRNLVRDLNSGGSNEALFNTDITLMVPSEEKTLIKSISNILKLEMGCMVNPLRHTQLDAYINTFPQAITRNALASIDMIGSTLGASYPFQIDRFFEKSGNVLGHTESGDLFSFDLFYNLNAKNVMNRTNSNMAIIGKSGAGKSFFSKVMIMNELVNGTKVLILDPENEYSYFAEKFHGQVLDMSKKDALKINPFEFVSFDDGENALTTHLAFLNGFFKIVLGGISDFAREELDTMLTKVYSKKKIFGGTDFKKLKSKDYPTFDDLIKVCSEESKKKGLRDNEKDVLTELVVSLQKFKKGNMYGDLWNCYTTFKITNDFTVFNFQGLQDADIVRNATMLLVTNMINKVIIENMKANTRLILMVDEAHCFIDPKFPIALDLMKNMAKRIRKYDGSLIVATQNILDFIGYDDNTKTKATAVLNNCQYTCLFGLKPNDMEEVKKMYAKSEAGNFTEEELDYLLTARRGDALMLIDTDNRVPFHCAIKLDEEINFIIPPRGDKKVEAVKEKDTDFDLPNGDNDKNTNTEGDTKPNSDNNDNKTTNTAPKEKKKLGFIGILKIAFGKQPKATDVLKKEIQEPKKQPQVVKVDTKPEEQKEEKKPSVFSKSKNKDKNNKV